MGDGDGHSIYLRTLINQTQGLSADVIGRTNPEGVRQSSADSELRRGYDKKIKKRGGGGTKVFRHLMSYVSQRKNHGSSNLPDPLLRR